MTVQAVVGMVVGVLAGIMAVPLVRWLPLGISERLEQPDWTRCAGRPTALVATGALGGLIVGIAAPSPVALIVGLVLVAVLVPACAIDLAWRVVPDSLVLAGAAASLVAIVLGEPSALPTHLLTGLIGGVGALLLALVARGGLGLGDVKLVAMLGVALGSALGLALAITVVIAGVAALPVLLVRGRRATLPLVPFLALGAVVAVALGAELNGSRVTTVIGL